eukprot:1154050-Pelagomonas_calceolata.AAC.4
MPSRLQKLRKQCANCAWAWQKHECVRAHKYTHITQRTASLHLLTLLEIDMQMLMLHRALWAEAELRAHKYQNLSAQPAVPPKPLASVCRASMQVPRHAGGAQEISCARSPSA